MDNFKLLALLFRIFEDGKITGKELKEVINELVDDNMVLDFSLEEVLSLFKTLLRGV